jgi:hypothetical protein
VYTGWCQWKSRLSWTSLDNAFASTLAMELSLGWGTIGIFGVEVVFSGAMVAKEAFESIRRVDDMWKFLVAMDMVVFAMTMRVAGSVPAIDIRSADLLNILNLDSFDGLSFVVVVVVLLLSSSKMFLRCFIRRAEWPRLIPCLLAVDGKCGIGVIFGSGEIRTWYHHGTSRRITCNSQSHCQDHREISACVVIRPALHHTVIDGVSNVQRGSRGKLCVG